MEDVELPARSHVRGPRLETSAPELDPAEIIAYAVLAGHVLPDARDNGLRAADLCRAGLGAFRSPNGTGPDDEQLARLLADADTISLLRTSGRIERAQAGAARRVHAAFAAAPGEFPEDLIRRAAEAAGTVAGMRRMARSLAAPAYIDAVARHTAAIRAARQAGRAPDPVSALARKEVATAAIAAAMARAAVRRLDGRLHRLRGALDLIAGQVRADRVHAGPRTVPGAELIRERVERRLTEVADERRQRAARLAARLIGELREPVPPPLIRTEPDRECLDWLHVLMNNGLYSAGDTLHTMHWLGSDPFGLRVPPPPPEFLAGFDFAGLRPEHVAPLFRRLSLTREAPHAADLTPEALDRDRGALSVAERTEQERGWGRDPESGAPLLEPVTRIPRVVYSIWLGGPPPLDSDFIDNVGYTARRFAGEIDYVLWTDIPRAAFRDGAEGAERALGEKARPLLDWARENGVLLVNIAEVFHRGAPMVCQAQYTVEMAKRRPHGYAAASDIVRLEAVERFGGFYIDGDLRLAERYEQAPAGEPFETLPRMLDRIAASTLGFTMDPIPKLDNAVNNDLIIAPAKHPAIRLWIEETRINYLLPTANVVGGLDSMARPLDGMDLQAMRYLAPYRTGRIHHKVLARLGLTGNDLPVTQPPIFYWSTCSWIPMNAGADPHADEAAAAPKAAQDAVGEAEVISTLEHCLTALDWQLRAREGNLYLTSVDPVVRALPDPDAAWTALLIALSVAPPSGHAYAEHFESTGATVTSVTYRRRADDGTTIEHVDLPPEALALLESTHAVTGWLGARLSDGGKPIWLLDECVQPALLRDARSPMRGPLTIAVPFAEVALDLLGRPLELRFGPPSPPEPATQTAQAGGRPDEYGFTTLPEGHFGLSLAKTPDWSWADEPALRPDTVAPLLLRAGAAGRPVLMSVPYGTAGTARQFAAELAELLGQDVDVIEGPLRPVERSQDPMMVPTAGVPYRKWASCEA